MIATTVVLLTVRKSEQERSSGFPDEKPEPVTRIVIALIAAGLAIVFVVAVRLEPDPRGFGTHEQLGLPPCQFRSVIGLPCPHCGMTTSFSNLVRGRIVAAWQANPLGIPLSVIFACGIPWCLATAVLGRWVGTTQPLRWFVLIVIGYLILAVCVWILQIAAS